MKNSKISPCLSQEAKKFDEGKLRMDLIPLQPIFSLAKVLTFGAIKYGAHNWEKGAAWSKTYAALLRHILSWWGGESKDPETGESHLAHALCNVVFLLEFERTHPEYDDRPESKNKQGVNKMHIGDSGEEKTKKYPFTEFMENSEHSAVVHFDCVKEMLEKLKEPLQRERMFYPPKDPQAVIEAKAKNWTDALKDLDTIRAKAKKKPSVAIDFDGTIAKYDHYRGKGVFGDPIAEAKNFIKLLKNMGWIVIINTTRSEIHAVEAYLMVHGIPFDFINYNPENEIQDLSDKKVLADVYVDDRAVRFDGSWQQTFGDIITARPWWKEVRKDGAE